jgi:hypothetical protein
MMPELEFVVRNDPNDVSIQIRIQKIGNGYVVKTGKSPVFYSTIEEAAICIKDGLIYSFNQDPFDINYDSPVQRVHFEKKSKHK